MKKTILIVDDASFMRVRLKDILTKFGYHVVGEADNGKEAITMFTELKPDLVMMDITMPEMDGLTAIKLLKSLNPAANIIICSAIGQQETVLNAIKNGAQDYIIKPFTEERVVQSVYKTIG